MNESAASRFYGKRSREYCGQIVGSKKLGNFISSVALPLSLHNTINMGAFALFVTLPRDFSLYRLPAPSVWRSE